MWTTFQNSRPNHAAPFGQSKPLSSSFKDKFKIYTSVPFKTKIPVSEDSGRRRPVKAYTIRNITKFRPSQTNSSSPLKRDIKDFSPTAATPLDITGFKEREMSMLPMTQGMIVDSDTEVDKETFKVSDHIKEKALTPEMRGRTGQISYGLKELLIDPKTKNTGGTYNLDWAKEYQNGNSKFKRCWTAKGLGSIEKNMLLDEEKYKKDVDDCIDRYADDDGDVDRVKQDEIETQEPLESEENGRLRPRTVYASDDSSGDGMPKTMEVVQVFPRKPSHSPTCLNVTVDMNIWEKYQEMQRPKDEDHLESSRVREMKMILDERSSAKYKQIKDSLKTGTFTRVHRYQYDAKRRTMVPSESPDKKGNTHRESSLLNKREDNMIHPLVSDNFIVEKVIGQGSYAVVRQVVERATGINYALKSYTKVKLNDVQRKENVKKEIEILKGLDHPNIIKLHKTIDTPTQLHLLLELGGSVSLQSYAKYKPQKRLLESEAKIVFRQLAEGLDYLHKNNVVHRDIKLDNILIDADKNIKIIDFGFSVASQKNKPMNIFCGTPSYMAPELVTRKYYFGHLVDIWALGISLYVMLCGFFPFKGITNKDLYNKIMRGQYQIPDYVSPEAKSLIRQMLRMNPHERPSASELLNDKWVTGEPEQQSSNLKDFLTSKIEEYRNLL